MSDLRQIFHQALSLRSIGFFSKIMREFYRHKGAKLPKSHKILYFVYIIIWIISAINPKYPGDWLLENILVVLLFPVVIWLDKKYHLSFTALVMLLIFASLHSLGAHFTYAQMEYFDYFTHLFGFERNHFDRLVHFLFGFLVFRTFFEIISFYTAKKRVALIFTFTLIVSISTLYEILEWIATIVFHPELGIAFLGTQGDVWDAQKDTLAAIIGAGLNVAIYLNLDKTASK